MDLKPKTQLARVAQILEDDGQIDNFFAMSSRLTIRLAVHINILRARGYVIETKEMPDKNAVYKLIAKPAPKQLSLIR